MKFYRKWEHKRYILRIRKRLFKFLGHNQVRGLGELDTHRTLKARRVEGKGG